jgi:hypothetical protein
MIPPQHDGGARDGRPASAYPAGPPAPPPYPPAGAEPVGPLLLRIFAVPGTVLALGLLCCVAVAPFAIANAGGTVANLLPVPVFGVVTAVAVGLFRAGGLRSWAPADLPVWATVLVAFPALGDELDLADGAALAATGLGLAVFCAMVARLIVFHVRGYRADRAKRLSGAR